MAKKHCPPIVNAKICAYLVDNFLTMKALKLFVLTAAVAMAVGAQAQIKNYSPVNYGPKDYGKNYDVENYAIAQNRFGMMYFGSANAIWEFDGKVWNRLEVKLGVWVKSILPSESGDTIFVGSQNDFGFLITDNTGSRYNYVSLADSIREYIFPFSDVWNIYEISGKVYFQSSDYIFVYNGLGTTVIEAETFFHNSFCVNGSLYVRQREIGLARIDSSEIKMVKGGEIFANIGIFGIMPIEDGKSLIISYEDGTWILENDVVKPNPSGLNRTLKKIGFGVTSCVMPDSATLVLGSYDNGILVIKTDGTVVLHKNSKNGLIYNEINSLFCDHERNIWFTSKMGITLLPNNMFVSVFAAESGISGSVNAIYEYNGLLFVGTSEGLFVQNKQLTDYTEPLFIPVEHLRQAVWSMDEGNGSLFIGTDDGLYRMQANRKIEKISDSDARCVSFCTDKNALLAAGTRGLSYFEYIAEYGMWVNMFDVMAENYSFNRMETETDTAGHLVVWLGTNNQGYVRVLFNDSDTKAEVFNENNGIVEGMTSPLKYNNMVYLLNKDHIYKYISREEMAEKLADSLKYMAIALFDDAELNLVKNIYLLKQYDTITWLSRGSDISFYIDGDTVLHTRKFGALDAGKINTIYTTNNRQVWVGTTEGLVLCDNSSTSKPTPHYSIIRRLVSHDSVLSIRNDKLKLPFSRNTLTFAFSAPWFPNSESIKFSYSLQGYLDNWQITGADSVVFTHLPEGTYTFMVKAVNALGEESDTAELSFTISPPWYRTVVAYIVYVLLLVAAVFGIIKYYTYQLKERNRLLDLEVKRQTKQINEQLVKIEEQNHSLTDSINYAARIQRMSLPKTDFVNNYVSESFILFKPRDIVSGDFYWCAEKDNKLIITAADCTGHGVPGAMMSMLGMNSLNTIVKVRGITDPGSILNDLRASVVRSFADKGENAAKDGMDICMLTIDKENGKLMFAGAYNSLLQIRNGELNEFKVDKFPCALSDQYKSGIMFTTQTIDMQKGDCYYFFSDGYCDQFGGEDGQKKFMKARFKRHLLELWTLPMEQQGEELNRIHLEFKGNTDQIDDILVIGIRI